MSVYYLFLCGLFLPGILGQTVEYGFEDYTKYEHGDMDIIITAPHGGNMDPSTQANLENWPDRENGCKDSDGKCIWAHGCGSTSADCDARTKNDLYAKAIARDIADRIKAITGFRPHVVYNMLKRRKLDANREVNEATLQIPDAITAYQNYTNFINNARLAISGRGFLLDIHGQAHNPKRTELGYLIYGSKLDSGIYTIAESSIRSLGQHWCGSDDVCFKDFVQGNRSLGHFMNQEGLDAVPSTQQQSPNGESYFSGGYTAKTYGSRDGGDIDAIQMEFDSTFRKGWRDNKDAQNAVAKDGEIIKMHRMPSLEPL